MKKIYKNEEVKNILSGIYKINFPNGKCYIGLSNNIHKRILQHNRKDYQLGRIVGRAIHKYGLITEFELLEEIPPDNRQLMNQREKYWINFYKSNQKEYGYNMTQGGDGGSMGSGINNPNAAFNQQQLNDIINTLKNEPLLTMNSIAERYNVNVETIRCINRGERYKQDNLLYPIRQSYNQTRSRKSPNANLLEEEIEEIIELLYSSNLTFTQIAEQYKTSRYTIGKINSGKSYFNPKINYPIRNDSKIKQIQYHRKGETKI